MIDLISFFNPQWINSRDIIELNCHQAAVIMHLYKCQKTEAFTWTFLSLPTVFMSILFWFSVSGLFYINDTCYNYSHILSPSTVSQRGSDSWAELWHSLGANGSQLSLKQTPGWGQSACHVTSDIVVLNLTCSDISDTDLYFVQGKSAEHKRLQCFDNVDASHHGSFNNSLVGNNPEGTYSLLKFYCVALFYWLVLEKKISLISWHHSWPWKQQ